MASEIGQADGRAPGKLMAAREGGGLLIQAQELLCSSRLNQSSKPF